MDLVVLAGGKSKRMGRSPGSKAAAIRKEFGLDATDRICKNTGKAFFKFDQLSLIETVVSRIKSLFNKIIISSADGKSFPEIGSREVPDIYQKSGSLAGLHAGLKAASSEKIFAVACDMPFVNSNLIRFLIKASEKYDIVVPRTADNVKTDNLSNMKLEPLHAIYSKKCIPFMEELLERGNLRIFDFYPKMKTHIVAPEKIREYDSEMLSFFNINTPDDLRKAYRIQACKNSHKTCMENE